MGYLLELGRLLPDFTQRGVRVIAMPSDAKDRAYATSDKLDAPDLPPVYTVILEAARASGLLRAASTKAL